MRRRRDRLLGWWLAAALLTGSALAGPAALRAQTSQKDQPKAADTKKDKKKQSKPAGREPTQVADTREVLSRVLRNFKDGFEALSPSSLRDWVLADKFYDYPRFEDGVTVFLRSVGEMRVFTREVSVEVEGDRAVMIIEAEMAFSSRQNPARSERRQERITFDFQRTPDGWKITEINPRSFFLP